GRFLRALPLQHRRDYRGGVGCPLVYSIRRMKPTTTLLVLFLAAVLEAGGDALVRSGLRTSVLTTKALWFITGGVVLFSYGWVVNAPPWDFGRLLGVYVVFFFVVAPVVSVLGF